MVKLLIAIMKGLWYWVEGLIKIGTAEVMYKTHTDDRDK